MLINYQQFGLNLMNKMIELKSQLDQVESSFSESHARITDLIKSYTNHKK